MAEAYYHMDQTYNMWSFFPSCTLSSPITNTIKNMANQTCCPHVNFKHLKEFVNANHAVWVTGKLIHVCGSHLFLLQCSSAWCSFLMSRMWCLLRHLMVGWYWWKGQQYGGNIWGAYFTHFWSVCYIGPRRRDIFRIPDITGWYIVVNHPPPVISKFGLFYTLYAREKWMWTPFKKDEWVDSDESTDFFVEVIGNVTNASTLQFLTCVDMGNKLGVCFSMFFNVCSHRIRPCNGKQNNWAHV
jgi:hypothetical protein